MKRILKFTATTCVAAALAVTSGPAAADGEDLGKIIAGIAVAGIIAKAIDDRRDKRERSRAETVIRDRDTFGRFGKSPPGAYHGRRVIDGSISPYRQGGPKAFRGFKKQPLPRRCLVTVNTRGRTNLAYGARCISRNFKFADKLPARCETAVRTGRGFRTVYGARCLARDGWRVARR